MDFVLTVPPGESEADIIRFTLTSEYPDSETSNNTFGVIIDRYRGTDAVLLWAASSYNVTTNYAAGSNQAKNEYKSLDFTSWEPFYSDFSLEHGRKIMQPTNESSYDWMDSSQTTDAKVEVVQTTDEWIDKCTNIARIKSFTAVTGPSYYDTLTFVMACDTASDGEQT